MLPHNMPKLGNGINVSLMLLHELFAKLPFSAFQKTTLSIASLATSQKPSENHSRRESQKPEANATEKLFRIYSDLRDALQSLCLNYSQIAHCPLIIIIAICKVSLSYL
jgi:hypothetical protein